LHPIVRLEALHWAASCARHCTRTARHKSSRLYAALHTDCATEELQIVRDTAHRLHDGRTADRARHCAQFTHGLCATVCAALCDGRAQLVRDTAHRLHDGRVADRAPHCAQTARRKSSESCATLRTDCATEELLIVRDTAHSLYADRARHCATLDSSFFT
jgi:hypothetical protein